MPRSTPRSRPTAKRSAPRRREPPRLVLDTNVLVSALLWTGTPNAIMEAADAGRAVLVASPSIIDEVRDVLGRPKLAPRIAALGTSVDELMEALVAAVEVIEQPTVEPVIGADPDDDHVLACAVAARARSIVSGDRHLLALQRYKDILIRSPAAALAQLRRLRRRRASNSE